MCNVCIFLFFRECIRGVGEAVLKKSFEILDREEDDDLEVSGIENLYCSSPLFLVLFLSVIIFTRKCFLFWIAFEVEVSSC